MDKRMMLACLYVAALGSLCNSAPVSGGVGVFVRSSVTVRRGHTTTLPCWLNPPQSAEGLEVCWYHPGHFDSPIMYYREKKFVDASQEASYVGRVSFGLKDAASGGLEAGDVSLRLENASIEDAGDYTCYVSSDLTGQGYDSAVVSLIVTAMGTPPLLSAAWKEDNMVNMSCESEGWLPEPSLRWLNQKQVLTPESLTHSRASSGLLSVHSWLLVPSSTEVSCSVGISDEEPKEARVHLEKPPQPAKQESGSSTAGWVAFAVLFIAMLVSLGVLYCCKKRGKKAKPGSDQIDGKQAGSDHTEETAELLPKEVIQSASNYVNVKLDQMGNQYLRIRDGKLRDKNDLDIPGGDKVTCLTAIKGTPGFSSGQHYWEVSLGSTDSPIGLKHSWWVGVTSATVVPKNLDFTPTTSNGFWFLSSSPHRADSFQFSTNPEISLPVSSRPQTVGVHLNYDRGELSFHNVEENSVIGSLKGTFNGEVFPFFNPGKGDKAPMEILYRKEQGESSDMGNSKENEY